MPDDPLYRFPASLESLDAMAAHLQATVPACDAAARLRAETALEELLTNSIVHGKARLSDDALHLRYEDAFAPFDPVARIDEALLRTANPMEQRPPGGLGLLMVFRLADAFRYRHENGRNRIELSFSGRPIVASTGGPARRRSVDLGA